MIREALAQAKKARLEILDIMDRTLAAPRSSISSYAPRLYKLNIPTDKIRDLIGPGGKKIKSIIEATGVKIDVLEDGTVHIFSTSGAGGDAALQMVREVTASAEVGKTYLGKVVRLADFGAFVEIFPGTDGLLHISEISEHRIRDPARRLSASSARSNNTRKKQAAAAPTETVTTAWTSGPASSRAFVFWQPAANTIAADFTKYFWILLPANHA